MKSKPSARLRLPAGYASWLTGERCDQFAESARLERAIRDNLRSLGYEV